MSQLYDPNTSALLTYIKLFYWRNVNCGFKDRGVLNFKEQKTAEKV